VLDVLDAVRIAAPERVFQAFPYELSGGMRQRVLIAMAIACRPHVIIADEPTTALDVTVQAQIMELLVGLMHDLDLALLLITHDLGLVAGYCDNVCVMYAGRIVETGPIVDTFSHPRHPYTRALMDCSLALDVPVDRFEFIPGQVPDLTCPPQGCRYNPRCKNVMEICRVETPAMLRIGKQAASCWLNNEAVAETDGGRPLRI
jgi:oligopeptide/dipeptide ABC transporter ATP-binding protein